ncbi:hypothetical protein PUNSTDRAFT_58204 [Punctularia strigosozonata HHB-11173 SS5]|uniref:uncharacterized protein n=1 Tax=Punctularia strigosozonata (strain HHB-11173) TaxID=741275 RepID=UPI0004416A54|nr:uncharacterized protein PUNSTDRAFT_58204 [Punctularia strigosozonata HHB-11173 SS5]EIN14000.1 hypothetical protein PUNSTDRAFT_58204 [Punctularia strigosozonata HHB-11173 SS5]
MVRPALLLVFSEPGPDVTLSEFHDWYDGEHVPLRVNTPTFRTWERWEQADGQKPSWAASYDLESYAAMQERPYTTLAETRSEREKELLKRVQLLDRRTYEAYDAHTMPAPSNLYDPGISAPIVVFVSNEIKSEDEAEWNRYQDEEHIPLLSKVHGWIRSRRFVLKESGRMGVDAESTAEQEPPPKYLTVHEWASQAAFETEEYKKAMDTAWRQKIMPSVVARERRVFKFLRRWDRD